jgi:hypothetical protein
MMNWRQKEGFILLCERRNPIVEREKAPGYSSSGITGRGVT